jgi:hypothetical protein
MSQTHSMFSVLDAAEQYVVERVKSEVARTVREKLEAEFNALVQEKLNEILPQIIIQMRVDRDIMSRTDDVRVFLEWVKCREEKKTFRTETVVKEVPDSN